MKIRLKFVSLVFVFLFATTSATAADTFAVDPVKLMNDARPTVGARGMLFMENVDAGVTMGWIRYSHTPDFARDGSFKPGDWWDWFKCNSWDDSACPVDPTHTLEGKVVLGSCINSSELGCIDKFWITAEGGVDKLMTLVGPAFADVKDTPESVALGIPRSSSPQIFKDQDGQLYMVRAGIWFHKTGLEDSTVKLDVDVNPVSKINDSSIFTPRVVREVIPSSQTGNVLVMPSPSDCLAVDTGICYRATKIPDNIKFGVNVRVPNKVSGWLRGRVSNPIFSASAFNASSQVISVSANPATLPVAGGWVKMTDLPERFLENLYPFGGYDSNPNVAYLLVGSPSQGERGVEEYSAWSKYFNDKALTTSRSWSFGTNHSQGAQPCMNSVGQVTGFVASNASVYSSNPPMWDQTSSTLTYKVGAPHFDENGKENVGTYTLAMPLSTIQCLYQQSTLPPSATVSLTYGSEVVDVATLTLKSDSGWVYFQANGFHYSNPTIQVKFAKPVPTPTATPSASPQTAAPKLVVQWCAKGYAKKKVTAVNPVCPKGYKKIKAPL